MQRERVWEAPPPAALSALLVALICSVLCARVNNCDAFICRQV